MRAAATISGIVLLVTAFARAQYPLVETVEFEAPSVGRTMRYDVMLPAGYHDPSNAARRYPTLYLLHDAGEHAGSWRRTVAAPGPARDRELLLVMPDAGDSYYLDWARSDDGRPDRWQTYIVDDVRMHLEATYRAVPQRAGRAVTGFGMGGYGALVIGLRHPDRFVSIGSQAGDLRWARAAAERMRLGGPARPVVRYAPEVEEARRRVDPAVGVPGFRTLVERTPRGQPFLTTVDADAHDPFMLVMQVARDQVPFIQIDASTVDLPRAASQAFAGMVLDADLPVAFTQRRRRLDAMARVVMYDEVIERHYQVMQQALASPAR